MKAHLPYLILLLSLIVVTEAKYNPCSGLWLGEIVANPDRCDKYYICVLTRPVSQKCDPYKIFDISRKKCVPGNPETCEFGDGTTTTTTTQTTTTAQTTTTTAPTTTTQTTTPQPPVNLEEICLDVFFAAKPYPNSLEIYVGCIRGNGVLFTCMENEFFHPVINECLKWPESTSENPGTQTVSVVIPTIPVSTSTFLPEPETSREPETTTSRVIITTPTPLEGICDGKFFEYVEHPSNCALFVFCYDEKEFIRQCPEFTIFDIKTATCKYGDQISCELLSENTAPITEPSSPTTEIVENTTVFNPCAGINNGNVSNLEDCSQFFRCIMSQPVPSKCPEGNIFDPVRLFCVSGDAETCYFS